MISNKIIDGIVFLTLTEYLLFVRSGFTTLDLHKSSMITLLFLMYRYLKGLEVINSPGSHC